MKLIFSARGYTTFVDTSRVVIKEMWLNIL